MMDKSRAKGTAVVAQSYSRNIKDKLDKTYYYYLVLQAQYA
jgi:hypothetical protein